MIIRETNPNIKELVDANDGYCPCAIDRTPENLCPCQAFREQKEPGLCLCGRYEWVE